MPFNVSHSFLLPGLPPTPSRVMLESDSSPLLCCFLFSGCLPLFPQCPAKGGGGGSKSWWEGGRSLHEKPAAVRGLGSRCACVGQRPPFLPQRGPALITNGAKATQEGTANGMAATGERLCAPSWRDYPAPSEPPAQMQMRAPFPSGEGSLHLT